VLHIDRFGNVVTALRAKDYRGGAVSIGPVEAARVVKSYSEAPVRELFLIEGSGGYMEISLREASAAARIGCRVGDPITLEPNHSETGR
jgi:S-adenosylmethionine hydrolase